MVIKTGMTTNPGMSKFMYPDWLPETRQADYDRLVREKYKNAKAAHEQYLQRLEDIERERNESLHHAEENWQRDLEDLMKSISIGATE